MTVVLGVYERGADAHAAIVIEGRLVVSAATPDVLPTDPHADESAPFTLAARCLLETGLQWSDLDRVALVVDRRPGRAAASVSRRLGRGARRWAEAQGSAWRWAQKLGGRRGFARICRLDAARTPWEGAMAASGFAGAVTLGLSLGGRGGDDGIGIDDGHGFRFPRWARTPHALGHLGDAVRAYCGLARPQGWARWSELSATGDPTRFIAVLDDMVDIDGSGRIKLDPSFFPPRRRAAQNPPLAPFSPRLRQTFGPARSANAPWATHHRDFAAAAQRILEDRVLALTRVLQARTGAKHFVLSGEAAANAALNGRILREGPFEEMYVPPSPGSEGLAVAAALAVAARAGGRERRLPRHQSACAGFHPSPDEIERACHAPGMVCAARGEALIDHVARRLAAGDAIGWFVGAGEPTESIGLGHRVVLACPREGAGAQRLRGLGEARDAPLAMAVSEEVAGACFGLSQRSDWAQYVAPTRPPATSYLGCATARVRTVSSARSPRLARLLDAVGRQTPLPVLVMTKLAADDGRPAPPGPEAAVAMARTLGLDGLVLADRFVTARASSTSPSGS
ncbi:MAG: carbamoyltransferase N-terminal domain-containing protein [Myxococcota bacterium]